VIPNEDRREERVQARENIPQRLTRETGKAERDLLLNELKKAAVIERAG